MKKVALFFTVIVLAVTLSSPSALSQQPTPSPSPSPSEYVPNDPRLDQTWARTIGLLAGWNDIKQMEKSGQAKATQAIVAVLDAEVYTDHPEFLDSVLSVYSYNATDEPWLGLLFSHGTANLGPAAAKGDNSMGIAGIAGLMDRVKFICFKVIASDGTIKQSSIFESLQQILRYKRAGLPIVVVGININGLSKSELDQSIKELNAEGIYIVVPASNSPGQNLDEANLFPVTNSEQYENIIPVVAGDESAERLATFSSYGPKSLRIVAPGVNVRTVSSFDPNGSGSTSGNSAVTFQVATAYAAIRAYREPDAKKAKEILYFTARMFPELEGKINAAPGNSDDAGRMAGRLDLHDALTMQFGCPAPSSDIMIVTKRDTNKAIAVSSPFFVPGPFALTDNFNADGRTRVVLFAYNVGSDPVALLVQTTNSDGQIVNLPVESMNGLNGLACVSQINLVLPQQLSSGDRLITITVGNKSSAPAVVSIK